MAFIHDESCECAMTELDVFSVPPTQTSIEYGNYVEYHPLSSITDLGPIEFDVSSSRQNYLDFANIQLLVKAKITRGNGDDITDADHVGGVILFLHIPASRRLAKWCTSQPVGRNVRLSRIHRINPQLRTPG